MSVSVRPLGNEALLRAVNASDGQLRSLFHNRVVLYSVGSVWLSFVRPLSGLLPFRRFVAFTRLLWTPLDPLRHEVTVLAEPTLPAHGTVL